MVPRENKSNAYAKFGGKKKRRGIMVFSEVIYGLDYSAKRHLIEVARFICCAAKAENMFS